MSVEMITSPATVPASASYFVAKRYDVTATGADICNSNTDNAVSSSGKKLPINNADETQTKNFNVLNPIAVFKLLDLRLATATPSVNNIRGIAICAINSMEDIINTGTDQSLIRKIEPNMVAIISGSFFSA